MGTIIAGALWVWGIVVTLPFLLVMIAIALWAAYEDGYKTSALFTMLATVSLTALLGLPWHIVAAAYLPIGFVWSFWRWRVLGVEVAEELNRGIIRKSSSWSEHETDMSKEEKEKHFDRLTELTANVPRIVSWCFSWPVSMIERLAHDLIHLVKQIVTGWFASIYNGITKSARGKLE